ncbi:MAG: ATP-dependent helicase [Campylobacteraceae bacterium]|jgi:DNA helicase-2/ATP-dependent DNA helicase PcrA|nr:ATP-dependent helicase [Campylobacteraceae bacterium]
MPLSRLNQEQYAAATAPLGHNLVIASAGTGKTSTIVARIAHLLQEGIKPEEVLLLTFTNKAANEMIERVARFFDKNTVGRIEAGTFHAVSHKLLKKIGKKIILKQPKELKILLKTIHAKRRFDHIDAAVKPYQSSYLYDLFSLYQNSEVELSFSEWLAKNESEHSAYFDIYEDILEEFGEGKRAFSYVDFNDLLILLRDELRNGVNELFFKEILIDEYQDTNTLQGSLIKAFTCKSVFCVGDYDQSIYAFNGANIKIIGTFKERYSDANIFTLDKNYRSSQMILSLANRVIEKNPRLYPKELKVTRDGMFEAPKLLTYNELFEQYQAIAGKISHSNNAHSEIAVIFRNNSSADGIEASLRELGIKCKRKGSSSFFDSREVKAILDLVSLFVNPKDMMAFIHIFEYAKGVGAAFSKELFDALLEIGSRDIKKAFFEPKDIENPFKKRVKNSQLGLFDDLHEMGSVSRFYPLGFDEVFLSNPILKNSRINEESAKFIYGFYKFLKDSRTVKLPSSLVEHVINSYVFEEIVNFLAKKRGTLKDGSIDNKLVDEAKERIMRKAWLLRDLAKNYNDIFGFLNALTLGSSEMSEGEGINLLSIHASKGLEFKEVYIVDLMDGRFPNRKLMSMGGGSLEEERRLFYVAATRAKDRLFLSFAKYDKIKKVEYAASQFLSEAGFALN